MSNFVIQDSVAFVTGTNKKNGIGRAIVKQLVTRGASKVYATARSVDALQDLAREYPGKVVPVQLDVTDDKSVTQLGERYPDVNLLVNNAGVFTGAGAIGDPEKAGLELAVNYIAPLRIVQSFASSLRRKKSSAIVNINSIASLVNFPLGGTYSASKAATHSLTQAQRREFPQSLVVGVCPGPIDTEMARTIPLDKASPSVVAEAISAALEAGQEDVFPDPLAQQLFAGWKADAKALETQMAQAEAAQ